MRITLPVSKPIVTCYPWHCNQLAIISTHEGSYPWIFNNFLHIFCQQLNDEEPPHYIFDFSKFDFFYEDVNPFLRLTTEKIKKTTLSNLLEFSQRSLCDFIMDAIKLNKYVTVHLDDYYLPNTDFFREKHIIHELLIYGFDNEQEIFQTAAFFKNSKYQFSTNTYSDILDAYNSAANNQDIPIHLCTFNHEIVHEFNVELVTRSLECYLAGEDFHNNFSMYAMFSSENNRRKAYYGINVYDAIIIMLSDLINGTREHLDIRALQILYDHKNIMVKRLEFCLSHGFLNDSNLLNHFSRLAKELEYIRNMSLKYMFTNDAKLIEKMVYQLDEIREQEVRATNELIMELKKGMGGQTS